MEDQRPDQPGFVQKIISGGQTGVDRAALDFAILRDIPHGGWCPLGRRAEDGVISSTYNLEELPTIDYADRTRKNIIDSDGTLVIYRNRLQGGSLMTRQYAERIEKPVLAVRLPQKNAERKIYEWILDNDILHLNIAGPRSSKDPKVYAATLQLLDRVWKYYHMLDGEAG